MSFLQVQLKDRLLSQQEGKNLDQLLSHPDEWLAPFKQSINDDPKLALLIQRIAFEWPDSAGKVSYVVYCNPVDNNIEPYEAFTFYFSGTECTDIKRSALCPW